MAKHMGPGRLLEVEMSKKCALFRGAKHIWMLKCTKHTILGPLLELKMSKKCTPLRHEAHWEVKMHNALHVWATFAGRDVEKVHAVVARSTFGNENVQKTQFMDCLREAHVEVKMDKAPHVRATFGGRDVKKVHAVVARSTLGSANVQNTTCLGHFCRSRCRKSARCCGAKHLFKSKCISTWGSDHFLTIRW